MSTETERLAQEAETRRSQVDQTLDQLKDRFSVGQIVDELSGYVREGQGAEMVSNLNRQVRDNPLALGLVGAGIAWLLLGQGARDQGHRLKDRYDDWRDDDDSYDRGRLSGGGYPIADGRPHVVGSGPYAGTSATGGSSGSVSGGSTGPGYAAQARGAVSSAGSSVAGAASSAGSSVADAARSAGSTVSGTASSAASGIGNAAHAASEAVTHGLHDARDAAYGAGGSIYRGGAYAGQEAARLGRRARRSFLDTLQEEPLIVGAVAVAIGAAIGAALPATRREDELFGGARDQLLDDALDYGREGVRKAETVASEAYKAGTEEADRKGLKPEGSGGETIAEKVSSVAAKVGEAAQDSARKEGLI